MTIPNCFYGINKDIDNLIINELLNELRNDFKIHNSKPYNLKEFYDKLDDKEKNYSIQSFTCFQKELEDLVVIDRLEFSVCPRINELRLNYAPHPENSKDVLDIINLGRGYSDIYTWLNSLDLNDLVNYYNKLINHIDVTFDNNYFILKMLSRRTVDHITIMNMISSEKLLECINSGLIESCIKYRHSDFIQLIKKFLENFVVYGMIKYNYLNSNIINVITNYYNKKLNLCEDYLKSKGI